MSRSTISISHGSVSLNPSTASTPAISISSLIAGSTPGSSVSSGTKLESSGIPGRLTSPMRRPCQSVKINSSGWSLPRALTRAITRSGMGITSQLRLVIFLPVLSAMNLWPPCRFPLGPSEMAPLVLATCPLRGDSSS